MAAKVADKSADAPQSIRIKLKRASRVRKAATGASVRVEVGLEVVHEGRLKRITAVTNGCCYLEDIVTKVPAKAKHGEYTLPEPSSSEARLLTETKEADRLLAQQRYKVLGPLARLDRNLTRDELEKACDAVDLKDRSTREIIRSLRILDSWTSCLPDTPGPDVGTKYITGLRRYIFDSVVKEELKKKEGITWAYVTEKVNTALVDAELSEMSPVTIRKYLRGQGYDLGLRNRLSGKVELETITPVGDGETATRPLEKVQIDSTRADVIIVDYEGRPINRPWITMVIDVYSRAILGIFISLDAPSCISVGAAIVDALTPKHHRLKMLGLDDLEWPCHGKFESICGLDHGAEHKNMAIANGIRNLGLPEPKWRRDITHGAIIERVIGTFVGKMHLLPGTTFSNPKQRGDYDSEKTARLTIDEFEQWMVAQIVKYLATPHGGLDNITPLQKWESGWKEAGRVPDLIQNERETRISFLPFKKPTATKEGLKVNGETYRDHQLAPLIRAHIKVQAHYDPRDLSRIWIKSPLDGKVIEIRWIRRNQRPYSLAYRQARTTSNRRMGRNPRMRDLARRAGQHADAIVVNATAKTKRRRLEHRSVEENRERQAEREMGAHPAVPARDAPRKIDWAAPPKKYRVWSR